MRPIVICHMLSSVDGKTDGSALKAVIGIGEYEATAAELHGDAWICGRTTMQQHFAEEEPFVPASTIPAGPQPVYVAHRADSYAISVDTLGKLRWGSGEIDGEALICITSEKVPQDYLTMLRETGISYIVTGESSVNLAEAVRLLGEHFGIRTLLLEGGGHINGAFLEAGLVDELCLLLVPGIDGRHHIPSVFDGVSPAHDTAVPLKLKSVERRQKDALWIRYEVVRS